MFASLPVDYREFVGWNWPQFEPYYQDLNDRSLSSDNMAEWLADWSRISRSAQEAYARLYVAMTLNTADPGDEQRYTFFLGKVYPQIEAAEQRLKRKLIESGLVPDGFEIPLRNMRAEAEIFREENLSRLAESRKLAAKYDKVTGTQTVQWEGQEITLEQLRAVAQHPDRGVRERAWRLAAERWLIDRGAINDLWRQLIALRRQIAASAACSDYRAYRWRELLRFDYTPADCATFHAAIEEVVVPAATRAYEQARQRLNLDTIRPWDLDFYLFTVNYPAQQLFQNALELIDKTAAIFQQVDPQLGDYYNLMRREELLDLASRKGKAPGGYSIDFPVTRRPFIFMNAAGKVDDVYTLLHEAGHSFHTLEMLPLSYYQQTQITMEIAELASQAMELLAMPYLSESDGGFFPMLDHARLCNEHLERFCMLWPLVALVDAFQHWVYTSPDGDDPSACDAKWVELQDRYMPAIDWHGLGIEQMTGWQHKLHLFEVPFYYVEYGLSLLGAVQVWRNALKDPATALANYRRALSLGGTKSLPELYAAAGVKFAFDANTLREAVDLIESVIAQRAN
jgi:oligoendopeptidase F